MQKALPLGPFLEKRRGFYVFDDFETYTDAQRWTKFVDGSSTVAINKGSYPGSGVNGWLDFTTDASVNDGAGIGLTNFPLEIRDGCPINFECRINYQEANVNAAIIAVGIADVFKTSSATVLQNTTGGPVTSFNGAMIFKVQGSTTWKVCTSIGTTQSIDTSTASSVSTSDQILRIEMRPVQNGGLLEVNYWIMDVEAINNNAQVIPPKPIKHRVSYTNPMANMGAGVCLKNGVVGGETLHLDYVTVEQFRGLPGS